MESGRDNLRKNIQPCNAGRSPAQIEQVHFIKQVHFIMIFNCARAAPTRRAQLQFFYDFPFFLRFFGLIIPLQKKMPENYNYKIFFF